MSLKKAISNVPKKVISNVPQKGHHKCPSFEKVITNFPEEGNELCSMCSMVELVNVVNGLKYTVTITFFCLKARDVHCSCNAI